MFPKTNLLLFLLLCSTALHAQRHSVLLHEIMADPQPPAGLPDAEYIELRNSSNAPVNLAGWRLQVGNAVSGAFPAYSLLPDSLVVIASRNNAPFFGPNTLGILSFPALPNGGATLVLRNRSGALVHAVAYAPSWYGSAAKAGGGWSLEMIDAANPCAGAENWKAAQHPLGGTPGRANSVQAINLDETPPALLAATAPDSLHLLLYFSEGLDSAGAALPARYQLQPELPVVAAVPQGPLFRQVVLQLQAPLQRGRVYTVTALGLTDCAGNGLGSRNSVPAGLPQHAAPGDVVFNEILFNPKPEGADYIELYNQSSKIIDVGKLSLAARAPAPAAPQQPLSAASLYLFPYQYAVLTEGREAVLRHYLVEAEDLLWEVAALPSMPDDKGTLVLLNEQGETLDALTYADKWHHPLLSNTEGVALERISANAPTGHERNWTSAATAAGGGTPTYRNSQTGRPGAPAASVQVLPPLFSPDGDGFDDHCTISFSLDQPNYVANVRIFEISGRQVRYLMQNHTVPQTGSWRWDGRNDGGGPLPTGTYIVWVELFDLQGKKSVVKKTVVLARK